MDRSDVKRRALLGAAKVAFSATLAACGGVVVVDTEAGSGSTGSHGGGGESAAGTTSGIITPVPWVTTGSTTTGDSTVATTGTGVATKCVGVYGTVDMPCCDALLEATFPDGMSSPGPQSADVVACCNDELGAKVGVTSGGSALPYAVLYQCCFVPDVVKQPSTCTPWGPPVPPSMPADLDWLDEAA
jgi:hypothetical protein